MQTAGHIYKLDYCFSMYRRQVLVSDFEFGDFSLNQFCILVFQMRGQFNGMLR